MQGLPRTSHAHGPHPVTVLQEFCELDSSLDLQHEARSCPGCCLHSWESLREDSPVLSQAGEVSLVFPLWEEARSKGSIITSGSQPVARHYLMSEESTLVSGKGGPTVTKGAALLPRRPEGK